MTKVEAMKAVIDMAERGKPGELSTSMCEILGISLDSFLQFAQLDSSQQLKVVQGLSLHFLTDIHGHCSQ